MRLLPLLLALVALAGCNGPAGGPLAGEDAPTTPSAPPPPPPPAAGQVRLAVGDTWTWIVGTPQGNATETARVVRVEGGVVAIERQTARGVQRTELDEATLAVRSVGQSAGALGGSASFDPPLPTVIPAQDHAWDGVMTLRTPVGASSQPAHAQVRFLGLETREVPAGTFECYRYAIDVRTDGSPTIRQSLEVWYAPAVNGYVETRSDNRTEALASYAVATPTSVREARA